MWVAYFRYKWWDGGIVRRGRCQKSSLTRTPSNVSLKFISFYVKIFKLENLLFLHAYRTYTIFDGLYIIRHFEPANLFTLKIYNLNRREASRIFWKSPKTYRYRNGEFRSSKVVLKVGMINKISFCFLRTARHVLNVYVSAKKCLYCRIDG